MSPEQARDIMLGVFRDAWVAAGLALDRVCWDDKPESVPTGDQAWARVTIKHSGGPTRAFGERRALYSNTGTLWVQIFTPVGDANVTAYGLAYAVVTAFRSAVNEGVCYRDARFREVGRSGAFEQTNVLTDFSYDD